MKGIQKTVLIAEASSVWQNRIRYRFEQEGFAADIASTFEEALRKLQEKRFDVLTLDLTLGGDEQDAYGVLLLADADRAGVALPPVMIISESTYLASIVETWNYYPVFYHAIKYKWAELARRDFRDALDRLDRRAKAGRRLAVGAHTGRTSLFVSKSFSRSDRDVNEYFEGILKSLQVRYATGEPYTPTSIPESIKRKIQANDVFLSIWVQDREGRKVIPGRTRTYLIGETEYAEGLGKQVILLVHKDITELGLFGSDTRRIPFAPASSRSLAKATQELLEAITLHGLV